MRTNSAIFLDGPPSREIIYDQLQRIFLDPVFVNSAILRRFLTFIVDESLLGHANRLKEYTIGVNVLDKLATFKPQENGIVRIHAGRLRRALNHYYSGKGAGDPLFIYIPKGSYVPVFDTSSDKLLASIAGNSTETKKVHSKKSNDKLVTVAVIPFNHSHKSVFEDSLSIGLGLQLGAELMKFERFSIIAYQTILELCSRKIDITTLSSMVGAQYIITGNIQTQGDRIRIHAQLMDAPSFLQLWGTMYERTCTPEHAFDLQDEIVKLIISDLNTFFITNEKTESVSFKVVA